MKAVSTEELSDLLRRIPPRPAPARSALELVPAIVLMTLIYTGARPQEICNLNNRDVVTDSDTGSTRFHVRTLKQRSKSPIFRTLTALCPTLTRYVQRYRRLSPRQPFDPFIITATAAAPYPRLIHRIVKAELPAWSPKALRHHTATFLMRAGATMPAIQHYLGHRNLNTTAIYIASLEDSEQASTLLARITRVAVRQRPIQSDFLYSRTRRPNGFHSTITSTSNGRKR